MRDDLILHVEEIGERLVEALGPKVRARLGFNELHIDAHSIPGALQTAVEHVAYIELPSDLLGVAGFAFVGKGGAAADDEGAGNSREVGCQAFGTPSTK